MTTTPTSIGRAATARHRHHPAARLFPAEHAYAVRLVQIALATPEQVAASAEIDKHDNKNAGIVPSLSHESGK